MVICKGDYVTILSGEYKGEIGTVTGTEGNNVTVTLYEMNIRLKRTEVELV